MKTNAPIRFLYDTVSLFLALFEVFSHFVNLLKSDVPSALKTRLFQQLTSQTKTLMRCPKDSKHVTCEIYKRNQSVFQYLFLAVRQQ